MIEYWKCPKCGENVKMHLTVRRPVSSSLASIIESMEQGEELAEMMFIGAHVGSLMFMKEHMQKDLPEVLFRGTMLELTEMLQEQVKRFRGEVNISIEDSSLPSPEAKQ